MSPYELIDKWIREANLEYPKAKESENYLKMKQIQVIIERLRDMKSRL